MDSRKLDKMLCVDIEGIAEGLYQKLHRYIKIDDVKLFAIAKRIQYVFSEVIIVTEDKKLLNHRNDILKCLDSNVKIKSLSEIIEEL